MKNHIATCRWLFINEEENADKSHLVDLGIFKLLAECHKTVEDETRNTKSDQDLKKCRSHSESNSNPGILGRKRENANLEADDNARSGIGIPNTEKMFLVRDRNSKRAATRDRGKNNEVRGRNSSFQGQRQKTTSAPRQKCGGNKKKSSTIYRIEENL